MPISGKQKYSVVSLFSGGMGLDLGLEASGRFELLACVEKEPSFCQTIRSNKAAGRLPAELLIFENDISDLDPAELAQKLGLRPGELDVLIGGPPCQSFSTAGRRGSTEDPRGTLLWDFLRFVQYLKPKLFLMENVRGLLSSALKHRPIAGRPAQGGAPLNGDEEPGSVIRLFAEDIQKLGGENYHMDIFEVNAVNYGAPQIRERVLCIGNRHGVQIDFPNPTHGPLQGLDAKRATLFDIAPQLSPWRTLRDVIDGLNTENDVVMDFSPRKKAFLSMVPEGSNWRSLPIDVQKESMGSAWFAKGGRSGWWRRLTFDLPSPTLVTMPNHASTSLCHPRELRALSVKEYAAIQEFPPEWVFEGTTTQKYAQVGNAVPVRLGRVAGDVMAAALDQLSNGDCNLNKAPASYRVIYIQSHVRTRQWFKGGKTHVWQDGLDNAHNAYDAPQTLRRTRVLNGS